LPTVGLLFIDSSLAGSGEVSLPPSPKEKIIYIFSGKSQVPFIPLDRGSSTGRSFGPLGRGSSTGRSFGPSCRDQENQGVFWTWLQRLCGSPREYPFDNINIRKPLNSPWLGEEFNTVVKGVSPESSFNSVDVYLDKESELKAEENVYDNPTCLVSDGSTPSPKSCPTPFPNYVASSLILSRPDPTVLSESTIFPNSSSNSVLKSPTPLVSSSRGEGDWA